MEEGDESDKDRGSSPDGVEDDLGLECHIAELDDKNESKAHLNQVVLSLIIQFLLSYSQNTGLEATFPGHELQHPDTTKDLLTQRKC
jgi:hypothetical protein